MKGFLTGCINGPAGGLNACTRLLTQLRTDTNGGCHRSPHHHHANPAASVLSHSASLTIELITGPLRVDPHMARSMPTNRDLYIGDGVFFFKTGHQTAQLARRHHGIFKVARQTPGRQTGFSDCLGHNGDGDAAVCGIKDAGGINIAQQPSTTIQPNLSETTKPSACIDFA